MNLSTIPLLILASSINDVSSFVERDFLESVRLILNLCAPGAFTLDVPWALSKRLGSSSGEIIFSDISKPIR